MLPADKDLTACRTCGTSRWKVDNKTKKVYKNIPAKAWRTIDEKFPKIAEDIRNLRLGISTDGVDVNTGNRHHKKNVVEEYSRKLCYMFWKRLKRRIEWLDLDLAELGATEASFENTNLGKRIAFLRIEHSNLLAKWLQKVKLIVERELAIDKESVSETVSFTPDEVGLVVEAIDLHISKEVATIRQAYYYGVLQEIWVLDYRFRQIPLFKCDWVNHKSGGVKRDKLRYTLVDLNNLGHKVDPFVLASQALQVFYVKDPVDKKLSIVFKTPPKNYKDTYDEVDEEFSTVIHHRNDNVLPLVDRRDLANESRDDYYRKDYGGVVIRKSNTSEEIDYDSPEPPKSLLKWYHYLSDEYKDNGRFWGSKSGYNESDVKPSWKDIKKAKASMLLSIASEASSKAKVEARWWVIGGGGS
ncbi:hypothetical protein Tco_0385824 [Tanacetum coccineum]